MNTTATTPTPTTPAPVGATISFKVKAYHIKPLLMQEVGKQYYFKILSPIRDMEILKGARKTNSDGSTQKPMQVANVFNYEDKHQYQLIINQVLGGALNEAFPEQKYVGKTFMISKTKVVEGRGGNKYAAYDLVEGDIQGVETPDIDPVKSAPDKVDATAAATAASAVAAETDKLNGVAVAVKAAQVAPAKAVQAARK